MPVENWPAFTVAAAILLVIPGPTILLVVSYALGHGHRPAAAIVAGVALGDLPAMTASRAGLGAVLAASADLFTDPAPGRGRLPGPPRREALTGTYPDRCLAARRRAIEAARDAVLDMCRSGRIGDDAYCRLEEEFD